MVEVADIFRRHGPEYRAKFADRMLPSHRKAMQDIEQCRTAALGGNLYACPECRDQVLYAYHSCKNRSCPKCQNEETTRWLEAQRKFLLPVDYFMVTYTLPDECRGIARSHQKKVYNAFFRASAETFMELAGKKKHLGGQAGMMGVLQTWKRDLAYHVHINYVVPGGALSFDSNTWLPHRYDDWPAPVQALSARFNPDPQGTTEFCCRYRHIRGVDFTNLCSMYSIIHLRTNPLISLRLHLSRHHRFS